MNRGLKIRPSYIVALSADLILHLCSSLFIAAWVYLKSESIIYAAIFILGGIFLDLDHLIDYFIFFKDKLNLKSFFASLYLDSGKVYLFMHSWEINFIIFAVGLALSSYGLLILSLALSIHMVIDNVQRENPLFYFFSYRFYKKFSVPVLLPEYEKRFIAD